MWELLAAAVVTPLVGYIVDRLGYARAIARNVDALVEQMPEGTAKEIAERAVIEANAKEAQRAAAQAARRRAEHEARMAAIRNGRGDVNVGNLRR